MKMIFKILLLLAATGEISQLFAPPENRQTNTDELERAVDALTAEVEAEIEAQAATTIPKASGGAGLAENGAVAEPQAARTSDVAEEQPGNAVEGAQKTDITENTAESAQQKSTESSPINPRLAAYAKARTSESLGGRAKVVATAVGGGLLFAPIGIAAAMHQADKNKEHEEDKLKKLSTEAAAAEASLRNLGQNATALDRYMAGLGLDPVKRLDDAAKLSLSGLDKPNRIIEKTSVNPEERQQSYNQLSAALLEDEAARRGKIFDENGVEVEGNLTPEQKQRADAQFTALAETLTKPTDKLKGPSGSFGDDSLEVWNVVMKGLGLPAPTDSRQLPGNKEDAREAISLALKAKALDAQLLAEDLDVAKKAALETERDDLMNQAKQKISNFDGMEVSLWQRLKAAVTTAFGPKDRKIDDSGIKTLLIANAQVRKEQARPVTTENAITEVATNIQNESTEKSSDEENLAAAKVKPVTEGAITQRALDAASARAKVNWAAAGLAPKTITARAKASAVETQTNSLEVPSNFASEGSATDKDNAARQAIATEGLINFTPASKENNDLQKQQADIENIKTTFGFDDKAASRYLGLSDTPEAKNVNSQEKADEPEDELLARPKDRQISSGTQPAAKNSQGAMRRAPELADVDDTEKLTTEQDVARDSVRLTTAERVVDATVENRAKAAHAPRAAFLRAAANFLDKKLTTNPALTTEVIDDAPLIAPVQGVVSSVVAGKELAVQTEEESPKTIASRLNPPQALQVKAAPKPSIKIEELPEAVVEARNFEAKLALQTETKGLSAGPANKIILAATAQPAERADEQAIITPDEPPKSAVTDDVKKIVEEQNAARDSMLASEGAAREALLTAMKGFMPTLKENTPITSPETAPAGPSTAKKVAKEGAAVGVVTADVENPTNPPQKKAESQGALVETGSLAAAALSADAAAETVEKGSQIKAAAENLAQTRTARRVAPDLDVAVSSKHPNFSAVRARASAVSAEERAAKRPQEIDASVEEIEMLRQQLADAETKASIAAAATIRMAEFAQATDEATSKEAVVATEAMVEEKNQQQIAALKELNGGQDLTPDQFKKLRLNALANDQLDIVAYAKGLQAGLPAGTTPKPLGRFMDQKRGGLPDLTPDAVARLQARNKEEKDKKNKARAQKNAARKTVNAQTQTIEKLKAQLAAKPLAPAAEETPASTNYAEIDADQAKVPSQESSDSDPMTRPGTAGIVRLRRAANGANGSAGIPAAREPQGPRGHFKVRRPQRSF